MNALIPIRGAGGGSKKGSNSTANTLRGRTSSRLLFLISEGEVGGVVGLEKGIYFGETPLRNADNSFNFQNVVVQEHKGLADEGYFNGHDAVETPVSVEQQVKVSTGAVVRTIVDQNADALRVIGRIPALVNHDEDSGAMKATSLSYAIDVRPSGGSWTQVVLGEIKNEKTTSPYPFAHRIELPEGGHPWDVRMRRITPDSTSDHLQNDLWWESYVVLVEGRFIYPHSAMVSLALNAEDLGSQIPEISFRMRGIKVPVPANYNPTTRAYTGIWNGTFNYAGTSNPAWIFYDLVTNKRYGLGELIDPSLVDKWSLYAIAQYCDQLVPSGFKDENGDPILEPRFTFNGVINSRDEAFFVLQQITAAWRGMAFWSLGQVYATADMPTDPSYIVSPANTVGHFNYSGTALKARHSVAIITWNDPNDFYRPATEVVVDEEAVRRYGWNEKPVSMAGCTSRGLAHRYGKWILDTEQNETETIEYTASLDQIQARPGEVIAVADPHRASVRFGGRIKSHAGLTVELDRAFEPAVGESYSLMLVMPDGSIETRPISGFAGAVLTLTTAFPQTTAPDTMFAITGTDITPKTFRIVAMEEVEKNLFKVTALTHDPNKYARVEQDIEFDPLPYVRGDNVSYPPTDLNVVESGYVLNGTTRTLLTLSWTPARQILSTVFRVSVETPNDGLISLGEVSTNSIDLRDVEAGDYTFYVSAVSAGGIVSPAASFLHTALGPSGVPLPTVSNFRLADRPGLTTFVGRDVSLAWENNFPTSIDPEATGSTPSNAPSPFYQFNTLTIREQGSNTLLRTQRVTGEGFVYSYDMNLADSLAAGLTRASRALRIELTITDVYQRTTTATILEVTNPLPAAPSVTVAIVGQSARVTWSVSSDADILGYKLWIEASSGFVPDSTTPKYQGQGNAFNFTGFPDETFYVRVAGYDAFSATGLNVSTIQSFTLGNFATEISEDFAEVPGYLFGDGTGTLADRFLELDQKLADLAFQIVSNGATGHVRRVELTAELSDTRATFLEQITVVADGVTSLTSRVTALETTVGDGSIVAGIVEELEVLATQVAAQATALTEVSAQVGDVTAGAKWAMQAVVAPSGVVARFSMMVRVTDSGDYIDSGLMIDISETSPGVYRSRVAIMADQTVVVNSAGTVVQALFDDDGALIRNLRSATIEGPNAYNGWNLTTGVFRVGIATP